MNLSAVNSNKIRLTINQWLAYSLGIIILFVSLLALGYLMNEYTIVCIEKQNHLARQCTLESSVFNLYHTSTNLGELKTAIVTRGHSSKGKEIFYVELVTSNGFVNLTGGSSSGRSGKNIAADAINNYVNNSTEKSFKVPYPTAGWIYALWALFPLIGIGLLTLKGATVDFDRILKTIVIKRKNFFHTNEKKLMFSDLEKVIIQESLDSKGSTVYRLALELKDKPPLPLVTTYDFSLAQKENIAKKINKFITQ